MSSFFYNKNAIKNFLSAVPLPRSHPQRGGKHPLLVAWPLAIRPPALFSQLTLGGSVINNDYYTDHYMSLTIWQKLLKVENTTTAPCQNIQLWQTFLTQCGDT